MAKDFLIEHGHLLYNLFNFGSGQEERTLPGIQYTFLVVGSKKKTIKDLGKGKQ